MILNLRIRNTHVLLVISTQSRDNSVPPSPIDRGQNTHLGRKLTTHLSCNIITCCACSCNKPVQLDGGRARHRCENGHLPTPCDLHRQQDHLPTCSGLMITSDMSTNSSRKVLEIFTIASHTAPTAHKGPQPARDAGRVSVRNSVGHAWVLRGYTMDTLRIEKGRSSARGCFRPPNQPPIVHGVPV